MRAEKYLPRGQCGSSWRELLLGLSIALFNSCLRLFDFLLLKGVFLFLLYHGTISFSFLTFISAAGLSEILRFFLQLLLGLVHNERILHGFSLVGNIMSWGLVHLLKECFRDIDISLGCRFLRLRLMSRQDLFQDLLELVIGAVMTDQQGRLCRLIPSFSCHLTILLVEC